MMPDGRGGQRLYLHHAPANHAPTALVLQCHALAHEMHFARSTCAVAARSMAASGADVLQIDLLGCGDSSGEFEDATWADWVEDLRRGAEWLRQRHPGVPLWLWGQRAGALLAVDAMAKGLPAQHLLLWQPMLDGDLALRQVIRLQAATDLADGTATQRWADRARDAWRAGRPVSLGGYGFSPELAASLQAVRLLPPAETAGKLVWRDTHTRPDVGLAPAAAQRLQAWQRSGWTADARTVTGPSFWTGTGAGNLAALVSDSCLAVGPRQEDGRAP